MRIYTFQKIFSVKYIGEGIMEQEFLKNKSGLTEVEFLNQYDVNLYEKLSVAVDMLIFTVMNEVEENYRKLPEKSLKLLLVKRGDHPSIGKWSLPGGFVGINEGLDEAAQRKLKTETNIENIYMEQLYTWGEVKRDPRTRVISCSYMALIDSKSLEIKAGDDATEARWFDLKYQTKRVEQQILVTLKLTNQEEALTAVIRLGETDKQKVQRELLEVEGIGFDHALMIEYALERLRNKIEYTDIAFNLMPERFTLSELQQVYEVILNKPLLAAAFRRKITELVIETEQFTKDAGHRPSKLYRFNSKWRNSRARI